MAAADKGPSLFIQYAHAAKLAAEAIGASKREHDKLEAVRAVEVAAQALLVASNMLRQHLEATAPQLDWTTQARQVSPTFAAIMDRLAPVASPTQEQR